MLPPIIMAVLRRYVPYVTLPFAIVVGAIGYKIESIVSDKQTPSPKVSVEETRVNRRLDELESGDPLKVASLKEKPFVPKNIFERNVSPSLQKSAPE
ncbi:hypothetical protein B4U79_13868 [Dinothrombium tinctorium]|uniref:Small integral membrane protein 12 n=1 Tax=Dinothrombium tinctorium TaxID=1965070 RepID=A0A443R839_9ACAR|nr:hypothetical protein B4U79_13868 [Dinothrombium tinctorium]